MDRNHLNNFERGPTKNHSCEVWSKSNQWFRRRCCLKIVNGRTDGRTTRTTTDGEWSQKLTLSLQLRWAKTWGWIVIYNPIKNPLKLEENWCSLNAYTFYKNNLKYIVNKKKKKKKKKKKRCGTDNDRIRQHICNNRHTNKKLPQSRRGSRMISDVFRSDQITVLTLLIQTDRSAQTV